MMPDFQNTLPESEMERGMVEYRKLPVKVKAKLLEHPVRIETPEGTMTGNPGDWLIKGVKGEFYPCKDDVFMQTYARVKKEPKKKLETFEDDWT